MKVQRSPRTPYVKAVRPMVRSDIEALRQPSARPRIQKLGATHRTMVRLFALGHTNAEVAQILGYSVSRVSLIRNSPAFQEQLDRFLDKADVAVQQSVDATNQLMAQGRVMVLTQMIEDVEAGELTPAMKLRYFDSFADRTNYHRKSTKENININFAAELEAAFERSKSIKLIEAAE